MVTRWKFDYNGSLEYIFPRNPDREGGDTNWQYEARLTEFDVVGSSSPTIQVDGFRGARRTLRFTAITGDMMRRLQDFYLRKQIIENCRDHLYHAVDAGTTTTFSCFIESFSAAIHPTVGDFPGSGEDTYDVDMTLIKMG